jgi:hypothetical protein
MTPWQTVFQRTMAQAGLEMPFADAVVSEAANAKAARFVVALRDLLRRTFERAVVASRTLQQRYAKSFSSRRMRVAQTAAINSAEPSQGALAARDFMRRLVEQATAAFRWLQQKSATKFASRRMRVAETVSLGEKRFVSILQVDGQQFLIGSATGQITLLAVLDDPQGAGVAKVQSA